MQGGDEHEDDVFLRFFRRAVVIESKQLGDIFVVGMDSFEKIDHDGHKNYNDPGTLRRFFDDEVNKDQTGGDGAQAVEERLHLPASYDFAKIVPVHDHTGLREGEGGEDADGIEGNESVHVAFFPYDEQAGKETQKQNAIGEDQLIAEVSHLFRHIAITGEDRGEARKIGIACVGCQHQNGRSKELCGPVEELPAPCFAKDGAGYLVYYGGGGLSGMFPVDHVKIHGQVRDSEQNASENDAHIDQRPSRVVRFRFSEGRDAVANGLGSGHGGTSIREGAEQKEKSYGSHGVCPWRLCRRAIPPTLVSILRVHMPAEKGMPKHS